MPGDRVALPAAGPPSPGGRPGDAKHTQCTVMMFGDHCLEVTTSTEGYVATSSGVAELLALIRAGASAVLLQQILALCGIPMQGVAGTDSSAAKGMAHRVGSGRVLHLRIQDLWIQERVRTKDLKVIKLDALMNRADIGTEVPGWFEDRGLAEAHGASDERAYSWPCGRYHGGCAESSHTTAARVRGVAGHTAAAAESQQGGSTMGTVVPLLVLVPVYTLGATVAVCYLARRRSRKRRPDAAGGEERQATDGALRQRS